VQAPSGTPTANSISCVGKTFSGGNAAGLDVCKNKICGDANPHVALSHGGCSNSATWGTDGCDYSTCPITSTCTCTVNHADHNTAQKEAGCMEIVHHDGTARFVDPSCSSLTPSPISCVGKTFTGGNAAGLDVCTNKICGDANPHVALSHGGCSNLAATWGTDGCDYSTCP
jgi:hypothetical protein